VGQEISLTGWLYNKRSSGKVKFVVLRDGSGYLQCVYFKGNVTPEVFDIADRLGQESAQLKLPALLRKRNVLPAVMKWMPKI
jgi:asparaginyl-tRNA synthetase